MIFIGSLALNYHNLTNRIPRDIDIMGTYSEIQQYIEALPGIKTMAMPISTTKYLFKKGQTYIEAEIAWPGSTVEEFLSIETNTCASIDGLYTLKMSHRFLKNNPHFQKTMDDIHLLRKAGAKIPDRLLQFYKRRVKDTYNYKHPKLNVDKSEFFTTPGITYVYDHDSIHEAVKIGERPAYSYFKHDTSEVFCDETMFNALDIGTRLNSVLEESYVLSIERSQVPNPGILTPKESFDLALEKVCTSITSGWWRDFAWEHYYQAKAKYNENYMEKFQNGLDSGTVIIV